MTTITQVIEYIITKGYLDNYLFLLFIYVTFTINGILVFKRLLETNNKLLILGSGAIIGTVVFMNLVAVLSYILKGELAIKVIFFLYTFVTYVWAFREKQVFKYLFSSLKKWTDLIFVAIFVVYLLLISLSAGATPTGGDVITYWGISTSFARGNFPTVLPWQPDILSGYHHGAFVVQGAIHAITSISISVIYVFSAIFSVLSIFVFLVGLGRGKTSSLSSLLPGVYAIVIFGGPIFLTNGFRDFLAFPSGNIINKLAQYPHFSDLKSALGAGPNGLDGLYYISFYGFALMPFLLFIYLSVEKTKQFYTTKRVLFLILLLLSTVSIDESFFFLEAPVFLFYFVGQNIKLGFKRFILKSFEYLVVFIVGFFLTQSMIRDSFFTPKPIEAPKFVLLLPNELKPLGKLPFANSIVFWDSSKEYLKGFVASAKAYSGLAGKKVGDTKWLIPDLRLVSLVVGIVALIAGSKLGFVLALSGFLSYLVGMTVVNPYAPYASYRLITKSYHIFAIALGISLVSLFAKKLSKLFWMLGFVLFLLFQGPQILVSHARLVEDSVGRHYQRFTYGVDWNNKTLVDLEKRLATRDRLLIVDSFPEKGWFSELTLNALQLHGLFIPKMTGDKRIISSDGSYEWFDAAVFLSPPSLRKLGVEYVFVENSALSRLPPIRVKNLDKLKFFVPIHDYPDGKLYKVTDDYKSMDEDILTLEGVSHLIPDGATVYLDRFQIPEIRKGMFVFLAKRTHLIGPAYTMAADYFAYIEEFHPFEACTPNCLPENAALLQQVDYILTEPDSPTNLSLESNNRFNKIGEIPSLVIWQSAK